MALLCLAVLGKENEPLYLRDVTRDFESDDEEKLAEEKEDYFGFASNSETTENHLALRLEFMMHASLDKLEDITGQFPGRRWRNPGVTGPDANWIGHLCPMEDTRIYGYITTTNVKFLAMIEDSPEGIHPSREGELKSLFSTVHELYVQYTLNPFSQIKEKIKSERFDEGVNACVEKFNLSKGSVWI
mmetsp:Transcript_27457/g.38639  ORF Transcript_27457/g.38639 Transcript_27457/m.38639 type:complete len:187 (+) Transcript_27457:35-595(+)